MEHAEPQRFPGSPRWIRVRAVHVAAAVVTSLAIVAVAVLVRPLFANATPLLPVAINPRTPPSEFLYFDSARVLAYLSQLEGGLSESERRTVSTLLNAGVQGTVAGVGGSASSEATRAVEQVVTATDASRFIQLRDRLKERGWLQPFDARRLVPVATRFDRLRAAREGGFVEVSHVRMTVPALVTVYRLARRSGAPDAKHFVQLVGTNPRVPLSFRTESAPMLLFVGRYASLADETSLFFGEVTVVGKVIRRVVPNRAGYVDSESLATYATAPAAVPEPILRRLRKSRSRLVRDLRNDVTVDQLGAVILPIAIYK
jgi:hypothetical protein